MTRQTSIDVYNKIKENGYLGLSHERVYHVLFFYGPMTVNEVFKKVAEEFNLDVIAYYANSQARLSELVERGCVRITARGKRECSVTSNVITEYEVTDQLPVKAPRKITSKQKLKFAEEYITLLGKSEEYQAFVNLKLEEGN